MQPDTVHGEQIPARARREHHPRHLEHGPLEQVHAFHRALGLAAAESREGGQVRFVGGAVAVGG